MSAWLGGGKAQTLALKPRERPAAAEEEAEQLGEPNEHFQETLPAEELPLPGSSDAGLLRRGAPDEPDLSLLVQDFLQLEGFEEPDEPWNFKSLKNEISHVVAKLYAPVDLPPFPA